MPPKPLTPDQREAALKLIMEGKSKEEALRRVGYVSVADKARADIEMLGQSDEAKKRRAAVDILMREGMTRERAMDQVQSIDIPRREFVEEKPTAMQSFVSGVGQGATLDFEDELTGAIASAIGPEGYEKYRDVTRERNAKRRQAHPWVYGGGEVFGGAMSTVGSGANIAGRLASKGVTRAAINVGGAGAAGGMAGVGYSEADLRGGEFAQLGKDAAVGLGLGVAGGAAGLAINKGLNGVARNLQDLGQARLFKAAVGQNKRAFTQMTGKGLFDKAAVYLDKLGIGLGDTTESIGEKLTKRRDAIDGLRATVIEAMDSEVPPSISPLEVAERVEKRVAEQLKKLAANQDEYRQAQAAIDNILSIGDDLSFVDAAKQRAAYQQRANYDRMGRLPGSEKINRQIAEIWNEVIDERAAPVLQKLGRGADEYRELRHEYALVQDMLGHVNDRIQGNRSVRMVSPSDYGAGGIAGIMTGNPFLGVAAAVGNHLSRVYGNAAAGRGAVNVAKVAAASAHMAGRMTEAALRGSSAQGATQKTLREILDAAKPVLQWPPSKNQQEEEQVVPRGKGVANAK